MRYAARVLGMFLLFFMLLIPETTSAATIFEHQHMVVPTDQTVDDVYVVGGDAEIQGHVTGVVVVINGDLRVESTAQVDGLIVVVGGKVNQAPGAALGDDVYAFSLDGQTQNSLLIGGGLAVGLWVVQLGATLLLVLIPLLISLIAKKKTESYTARFSTIPWSRLLYMGFLSSVALTAISALLLVTIIGIPVLIVLIVLLAITVFAGLTIVSHRIGEQLRAAAHKPDWLKVMMGAMLIAAFANVPFIGWIVLLLVILISFGVCVEGLASRRKRT
ncbi:hypothetical protein ABE504_13175 [Paenibacillus oryzisoli]|uniref:hypothetical protein n=1 Tax=Paenibacillus oryzisoli TaxID=1850517 RepID=UPI003D2C1CC5